MRGSASTARRAARVTAGIAAIVAVGAVIAVAATVGSAARQQEFSSQDGHLTAVSGASASAATSAGTSAGGRPASGRPAAPGSGNGNSAQGNSAKGKQRTAARAHRRFCPPTTGLPNPSSSGEFGCTYVVGYSDVRKLNGAALIGPGLMNLTVGARISKRHARETIYSDGLLLYRGKHELPPATATFLTFGFMPTTATLQLTQLGFIKVVDFLNFSDYSASYSTATARLSLRIYQVRVNGTPLDVGPDCRTVRPIRLVLRANAQYSINTGGVLAGPAVIPPFTGCGVGENLDPLFNGTISGPGNYIKMTQGNLCTPEPQPFGCPARRPKPQH